MRQVIRRFLKHLVVEKNASSSTIDTYRTTSTNSTVIWRIDWGAGSYQVMFPAITFAIISRGSQMLVIKARMAQPLVPELWQPYDHSLSMLIEQDC
jgi:hypothetical protein